MRQGWTPAGDIERYSGPWGRAFGYVGQEGLRIFGSHGLSMTYQELAAAAEHGRHIIFLGPGYGFFPGFGGGILTTGGVYWIQY